MAVLATTAAAATAAILAGVAELGVAESSGYPLRWRLLGSVGGAGLVSVGGALLG